MKYRLISAIAAAVLFIGAPVPAGAAAESFSDIGKHWGKAVIEQAAAAGYVKGYPDGTFKPDASVSRAEFLAIVTRASKLSIAGGEEPFVDVDAKHWAVDAVQRAIGMGFILPSDFGARFEPDKALTRAEMVKWLVSGLVKADASFHDALSDTKNTILPFTEFFPGGFKKEDISYIAVARGTGLVGGFPDGSFGPNRTTTRAEVVALLSRYLAVEGTKADGYRALNEMREVGLYGTNIKTIGNAEWLLDFQGNQTPFYEALNIELKPDRPIGTIIMRKFILVDQELSSVYKDVFLSKEQQERFAKDSRKYFYRFAEVTLTPSQNLNITSFQDGSRVAAGSTFLVQSQNQPDKYGFSAITSLGEKPMFNQGHTSTFWNATTLNPKETINVLTKEEKWIRAGLNRGGAR